MDHQFSTVGRIEMAQVIRDTPDGEELVLCVTGWSMMPLLFHQRSLVYLRREENYCPRKRDIVLFRRLDGTFVLHRVHRVEKDGFLTINGDAQNWTERILPEQVLAVVTRFYRRRREYSVDGLSHRIYRTLWCPLRFMHPLGAKAVYFWHRVPEKLFGERKRK